MLYLKKETVFEGQVDEGFYYTSNKPRVNLGKNSTTTLIGGDNSITVIARHGVSPKSHEGSAELTSMLAETIKKVLANKVSDAAIIAGTIYRKNDELKGLVLLNSV